jgi:hypothetical protein
MPHHRFQIGDTVDFTHRRVVLPGETEVCEILRLLSTDGDDPQYRVKCSAESFERVVRESQLREIDGQETA